MAWKIEYEAAARKELAALDKAVAKRIYAYLRDRVAVSDDPRPLGTALRGTLRDYWRFRVGDYRVVCRVEDALLVVLVVRIAHRREVYR